MSTPNPTHIDIVRRALADTADDGCFDNPPTYDDEGFLNLDVDLDEWNSGEEDREHWTKLARASVSKLTDAGYSIMQLPEPYPDDTVHPYWVAEDINGPQLVRVTDSDEGVEGNWVGIEFSARYRTITRETARELGLALLAAAAAAEGEKP